MSDALVQRKDGWLSAPVADELVMMSADTGNYVTVSRVGARVWQLIEQPKSLEAICARLLAEYDVEPAACRADVESFLRQLAEQGAVELTPP
jgi:hypothetical protein